MKEILMSVKRMGMLLGLVLVAVAIMPGCATTGSCGKSDLELVKETTDLWAAALVEHDVDKLLSTISESFAAPQMESADKAMLGIFIQQAIDSGYLDDAEVSFEDAEFELVDDAYIVYPIDLMGSAGSVSAELGLKKEEGGWLIHTMAVDGI
jgi:hypothetical protein